MSTPSYKNIETVANRDTWRKSSKAFRTSFKVDFKKIKVLPGWNTRIYFEAIEELALDIIENGLHEPLKGDMSLDGETFWITDGERRYRAIKWLRDREYVDDNGKTVFEFVEVFPNPLTMKPVDKIFGMISSGVQKSVYKDVEIANGLLRIKTDFLLSNEAIGVRLGRSRQWVDDMIKLAKTPDEVKKAIEEGKTSKTAVIVASRTRSSDEMAGVLNSKTKGGAKMKVSDAAERQNGKSKADKDALPEVNFDKEQNEQEKQINQVAKCLYKMEGLSKGLNEQASKDFLVQFNKAVRIIGELKEFYSKKKNKEVPA